MLVSSLPIAIKKGRGHEVIDACATRAAVFSRHVTDKDTHSANFRGNPLYQATELRLNNSLNGYKTMNNEINLLFGFLVELFWGGGGGGGGVQTGFDSKAAVSCCESLPVDGALCLT